MSSFREGKADHHLLQGTSIGLKQLHENGVFGPMQTVGDLPEHSSVRLTIETLSTDSRPKRVLGLQRDQIIYIAPDLLARWHRSSACYNAPMPVPTTTSGSRLLLGVLVFAVTVILISRFIPGTGAYQLANMDKVSQYLPAAESALKQDLRFREVSVGCGSAGQGTVMLIGSVQSQADYADLHRLIASTKPPRPIVDLVRIAPATSPATTASTRPIDDL